MQKNMPKHSSIALFARLRRGVNKHGFVANKKGSNLALLPFGDC